MTYQDAVYLKHAGETLDVKVTIKNIIGIPLIYMRDFEFNSFKKALNFLRYVSETEMVHIETKKEMA